MTRRLLTMTLVVALGATIAGCGTDDPAGQVSRKPIDGMSIWQDKGSPTTDPTATASPSTSSPGPSGAPAGPFTVSLPLPIPGYTGPDLTQLTEADLEPYYAQSIDWEACDSSVEAIGAECGWVEVPLDWSNPGGESIAIAVARILAADSSRRIGSLLFNPGGPGGSGIDSLGYLELPSQVSDVYDVVGFDPRGIKRSATITCLTDRELDAFLAEYWPPTDEGLSEAVDAATEFGQKCLTGTGPVLEFVDTGSASRDMDIIRAALGEEKLTYIGYSYGTYLGTFYAEQYPQNVGRVVLDGAINPNQDSAAADRFQIAGFEKALRAYVEYCQSQSDCPLTGTVDQAMVQIHDLIKSTETAPLRTGTARQLTVPLAAMGILVVLYSDQNWPLLAPALDAAFQGDGSELLYLADFYFSRDWDGSYADNSSEAIVAVNCLDHPIDGSKAAMDADAQLMIEAAPTIGEFFTYSDATCAVWPFEAVHSPHQASAPGADPIVVIGTTGDPATPYEGAVELANQLESGVLVTFEGEGHTAYGRSNSCVEDAVNAYLIDGTVPEDGLTC